MTGFFPPSFSAVAAALEAFAGSSNRKYVSASELQTYGLSGAVREASSRAVRASANCPCCSATKPRCNEAGGAAACPITTNNRLRNGTVKQIVYDARNQPPCW